MNLRKEKVVRFLILSFLGLTGTGSTVASAQRAKKPFTVADEIGLALFSGSREHVRFSPDRQYFAVYSERGRPEVNLVEDSLRFYLRQDVESFLKHPDASQTPSPVWVVAVSDKEGLIIGEWCWLGDSSGVAFLERTAVGNQRLVLADLRTETIEPLTSGMETVAKFDVRDRQHYVYTAFNLAAEPREVKAERLAPAIVGTDRSIVELLFPDDSAFLSHRNRYYLWAVVGGKRFEVKHDGAPLVPEETKGGLYLALSPDGRSVVATLPLPKAPSSWEKLYPPPYASSPYRIRAEEPASQYVRIDLQSGEVEVLIDAPTSNDGGWYWGSGIPSWSSDGEAILLPNTFIGAKNDVPSRPCVAVVDLFSSISTCVQTLQGPTETGWEKGSHTVDSAQFVGGDRRRVIVILSNRDDWSKSTTQYRRVADGTWKISEQVQGLPAGGDAELEVTVKQGLNDPPQLVATNKRISRVIWDPNPQLKTLELGKARVETWKDKDGRDWRGGLYLPSDYTPLRRYPLVIQTHGFNESEFIPSGGYSTAFAARALAAIGIAVLQVREPCAIAMRDEGPCAVAGYEAAVNKLVSEGLADPEKIGIIGFSRTCFYVMGLLTASSLHIKAASITDGQMITYFQYIVWVGFGDGSIPQQFDSVIGAQPFGAGLQQWLKRSPGFNLDKLTSPLLVVAEGPFSLLWMWESYAAPHYLQKPVDLIMLNTYEHVLTNPAVRMASQGGSVDWFRFWLQDYEDPDTAKAEQYSRWRELRKLAREQQEARLKPTQTSLILHNSPTCALCLG